MSFFRLDIEFGRGFLHITAVLSYGTPVIDFRVLPKKKLMHEFVFSSVSLNTTTTEKCSECSNTHLQDTVSPDPSQDVKQVYCLTCLY